VCLESRQFDIVNKVGNLYVTIIKK
jgi:hypothetical protein